MQQAAGDGELLFHAAGQFAGQRVPFVCDFKLLQQFAADAFVTGHLINPRHEIQMLPDREVIEQARFVGEKGELFLGGQRVADDVVAADAHGTARGRNDAGQTTQCGGLARAIRADQAHHFAGLDRKRKLVHGDELAVKFGETFNLNHALPSGCRLLVLRIQITSRTVPG